MLVNPATNDTLGADRSPMINPITDQDLDHPEDIGQKRGENDRDEGQQVRNREKRRIDPRADLFGTSAPGAWSGPESARTRYRHPVQMAKIAVTLRTRCYARLSNQVVE